MQCVALVTGGTRGIGHAIAMALRDAGHKVAADYVGNDAAAQKFNQETGIGIHKFDVLDFGSCAAGIRRIEQDLGPIDILANNAGVTRDAMLHKMTPQQWHEVISIDLNSCFNTCRLVIEGCASGGSAASTRRPRPASWDSPRHLRSSQRQRASRPTR